MASAICKVVVLAAHIVGADLAFLDDLRHGALEARRPWSPSPSQSSIILAARIVAMGLTLYWPAYFGAEPCVGSNTASLAPMLPEQPKPRPPTIWAHRSEMMSP